MKINPMRTMGIALMVTLATQAETMAWIIIKQ